MSENNTPETVQLNLATGQRNAGRDYYEYFAPGSIKLVLATWSKAKLDAQALDNSVMFCHRFGFEPTTVVRKQVLDIKNHHDLTDHEIRWFRYSGQLTITHHEAKLTPTKIMPIIGWSQLSILSLIFGSGMIQIAYSNAPEWRQMLGQMLLAGVWIGVAFVMHRLYIAPWQVLKKTVLAR